jgi:hypothetical protein
MPVFLWNPDIDDYHEDERDEQDDDFVDEEYDDEEDEEVERDYRLEQGIRSQVLALLATNEKARELVKQRILVEYPYLAGVGDIRFDPDTARVLIYRQQVDGTEKGDLVELLPFFSFEVLLDTLGSYLSVPKSSSSFNINKNT